MVLGLSFSADAHWPSLTGLSFDGAFGKAKQATPDSTQLSSTPDSTQVSSTLDSNGTFAFAPEAFPVPGVRKQERRAHPTFLLPAEPPSWGPLYDAKPFRERIKDWNRQVVGDLNALPYVVYVNIIFKMAAYWYVFARYLRTPEALFSEENIKRFIIYNILGDVLGLNSTGGPLGFRVKYFYVTWYNMLRPGSITCPLIPGWPAKRQAWQSAGYALYLYFLVSALRSEVVGFAQIAPILGTLAVLTPFDFITFQASRGEHYVYMLVGCLVPWTQTLPTLRLCQACLWFWAGTAKIGPWMKYVNAFMMPNSKLLALLQALGVPVSKLLYKDLPRDVNPSRVLEVLASFAVAGEVLLGPLCLFAPVLGVPLALCFHTYILSMTPFASVQEWNLYCIFMVLALFSATGAEAGFAGYSLASFRDAVGGLHPLLSVFLLLVLAAVPLYGQLYPKDVPFLTAMRPYAGNWRFTWHIVDNKAKDKLRKLKTLEGVFISENARMLWGANPHFCDQFEEYFTGNMVFFPHFRPLVPMIEKLEAIKKWKPGEYTTLFNEIFLNAVTGWTLGTGYYVRGRYFDAIASTCGFEPGECYVAVFEPHGLHDHTSEWHLVDITNPDVKVMHGKCPYAKLEKMQPCDLSVAEFDAYSVLGKAKAA